MRPMCAILTVVFSAAVVASGAAAAGIKKRMHEVPAGKYTAIVVSGIGDAGTFQSSTVTIKERGGKSYIVNGEPGRTTLLEFKDGWDVQKDKVTIEVAIMQGDPGHGINPSCATSVWGITPTGPVELPEK